MSNDAEGIMYIFLTNKHFIASIPVVTELVVLTTVSTGLETGPVTGPIALTTRDCSNTTTTTLNALIAIPLDECQSFALVVALICGCWRLKCGVYERRQMFQKLPKKLLQCNAYRKKRLSCL
jgi:hypothetical protein